MCPKKPFHVLEHLLILQPWVRKMGRVSGTEFTKTEAREGPRRCLHCDLPGIEIYLDS